MAIPEINVLNMSTQYLLRHLRAKRDELETEAGVLGYCVGMAKIAAVKLNTGSCPSILPASGNEQGLWQALWKKR